MRILIDADGCPVVDECLHLSKKHKLECIILCDFAHIFEKPGAQTITVAKGPDSVDFALVNLVQPGDIVVTQDYGLAAMCLAKRSLPIHQDGILYTTENIDGMLAQRHTARKQRAAGRRAKGPAKRTAQLNADFAKALRILIESNL